MFIFNYESRCICRSFGDVCVSKKNIGCGISLDCTIGRSNDPRSHGYVLHLIPKPFPLLHKADFSNNFDLLERQMMSDVVESFSPGIKSRSVESLHGPPIK